MQKLSDVAMSENTEYSCYVQSVLKLDIICAISSMLHAETAGCSDSSVCMSVPVELLCL